MNNLTVKIDEKVFLAKPEKERAYIIYSVTQNLQERLTRIEKHSYWDKPASFLGGMVGGMIAIIGKTILWK